MLPERGSSEIEISSHDLHDKTLFIFAEERAVRMREHIVRNHLSDNTYDSGVLSQRQNMITLPPFESTHGSF